MYIIINFTDVIILVKFYLYSLLFIIIQLINDNILQEAINILKCKMAC